jgi:hypothetical protein
VVRAQVLRRDQRSGHGQRLGEPAPAEHARRETDDQHHRRAGERRQETEREQRIAEQVPHDPEHADRQRRMVDVAPVHVLAAGEVVELVAEDAVALRREEMQKELGEREEDEDHRPFLRRELFNVHTLQKQICSGGTVPHGLQAVPGGFLAITRAPTGVSHRGRTVIRSKVVSGWVEDA